jgi:hypothetical protein
MGPVKMKKAGQHQISMKSAREKMARRPYFRPRGSFSMGSDGFGSSIADSLRDDGIGDDGVAGLTLSWIIAGGLTAASEGVMRVVDMLSTIV